MKRRVTLPLVVVGALAAPVVAQCPTEPPLANWTGGGSVACACFVAGEEAGSVFNLPPEDFPIEITAIGIGYGSQIGGQPQALEQSIHVYGAGLPNPGAPIFSLDGPQLFDGVINEFDIDILPGSLVVDSGPFTVTLEFFEDNVGDPFKGTAVHDGNGCQFGKNVIRTDTGSWIDACGAGLSGDWVFTVTYRPLTCGPALAGGEVPDGAVVPGTQLTLDKFGGNLLLSWGSSCSLDDDDYAIYEGAIGSYYSHGSRLCSSGGATASILLPPADSSYFLIVPQNPESEGSYGRTSLGTERPPGGGPCLPRLLGACP